MTNIEQKALELVNGACRELDFDTYDLNNAKVTYGRCFTALCRAIEQHEAFRQEVSDAVEEYFDCEQNGSRSMLEVAETRLRRFIIAKPDPLEEVMRDALSQMAGTYSYKEVASAARAALAKRGLEIREKE